MKEIIKVQNHYYILATSPIADIKSLSLKEGDTFCVLDRYGDFLPIGLGEQGLYRDGTKFLSRYEFTLEGRKPFLLSSTLRKDNFLLTSDLTNHDIEREKNGFIPKNSVHIFRAKFILESTLYERIRFHNFSSDPVSLSASIQLDADFRDVFEIRGMKRERRGILTRKVDPKGRTITFIYEGLDGLVRITKVSFSPDPATFSEEGIGFTVDLRPGEEKEYFITVECRYLNEEKPLFSFQEGFDRLRRNIEHSRSKCVNIKTSNERMNEWIDRSLADILMMMTPTENGEYPFAGIPWFATPFGRDGILTALMAQWVYGELGRGVLSFLASTQARETEPEIDAEPGKIIHEVRKGEMANTGEIPFGRYYGSVDATPLFVILADEYFRQTGDLDFIKSIWQNILDALQWMSDYGDVDGDGFIEYERKSSKGLTQQGWKDSFDSVFHEDGSLATGPIALVEVQAYSFAAYLAGARLARALELDALSSSFREKAGFLKGKFESAFWDEELGTYAIALDGEKKRCRVTSSNAGQVLFSGIASSTRAEKVAKLLTSDLFFTGWGIRTIGKNEPRYNPMSYHNGSVWPHDNAVIAWGFARYGLREHFHRVFTGLFDAATTFDMFRMPELFCGFPRRTGEGPTLYPVACTPQTWACASVFLLLKSSLGLCFNFAKNELSLNHPFLPDFLDWVELSGLKVGKSTAHIMVERHRNNIVVNVIEKEGPITVVVRK